MTDEARRADGMVHGLHTGHGRPFVQFEVPVPRADTPAGWDAAFWDAVKRFLAERDRLDHQDMETEGEGTP